MPLQTANQYQLGTDFSRLGTGFQQGQQIANQFQIGQQNEQKLDATAEESRIMSVVQGASEIVNLPDDASKLNALYNHKQKLIQQGKPTQDTDEAIGLFESGDSKGANGLIQSVVDMGVQTGRLKAPAAPLKGFSLGQGESQFDTSGKLLASVDPKPVSDLDKAKINNLNAEADMFKGGANTKDLDTLVSQAPPELQQQAKSAYSLSGGGKDGVKAAQEVLEKGVEIERRANAPLILKERFPEATPEEAQQLQSVVDAAKDTESGFKEASKVRDKQRQVKKFNAFQGRAVELLDKVLSNPELNAVIGSIEGTDKGLLFGTQYHDDDEANAIADIKEAADILTGGNLDVMTGVLSETDIQIIRNLAGGALDRTRSEERFIKDVTELRNKLAAQIATPFGGKKQSGYADFAGTSDEDLLSF